MFVTIEGIDGSGKTSVLAKLADRLKEKISLLCVTREPGVSPLGAEIRNLVLAQGESVDARAELFLFLADRAQHVATVIRPALEKGALVLCDRYSDSTRAYQSGAFDPDVIEALNEVATGGLEPELTILLDLDVALSLSRVAQRRSICNEESRFDAYAASYHQSVRERYLKLMECHPKRIVKVDASAPLDTVVSTSFDIIWDRYKGMLETGTEKR